MWHWDQGRLDYFQFDELRKIAKFAVENDLRTAGHTELADAVGLPFLPISQRYRPWRNYSRIFKLAMIAVPSDSGGKSEVTEIGRLLAQDGKITTDEYMHFLAQTITDPSPSLAGWSHTVDHRFPLLFSLRLMLARASQGNYVSSINDVITAYAVTELRGNEDLSAFLEISDISSDVLDNSNVRQASESLKVIAQLSYLSCTTGEITVSLAKEDAIGMFNDLKPLNGNRKADGSEEILRLSSLFPKVMNDLEFNYTATVLSEIEEAGFSEGGRIRRTHLTIERNRNIRKAFFVENPTAVCDLCGIDTAQSYPWTQRVLDIHHLLPLCSGARTSMSGTLLNDLVANCPTCHRAVHRYYDSWLTNNGLEDFADAGEARSVYGEAKSAHIEAMTNDT